MTSPVPTRERFTLEKAKAKIGKTVRLLANYDRLTKGMIGYVVDFHEPIKDEFELIIRFELADSSEPVHLRFDRNKYYRICSEQ